MDCHAIYEKERHAKRCLDPAYKKQYRAARRQQWANNRPQELARLRESKARHGAKWKAARKAKHRGDPIPHLLAQAKVRARQRGLEFDISVDDLAVPAECPVLGIPLMVSNGYPTKHSPSLDRIDNTKGYVKGNVVVISYKANTIKNNACLDELRRVVAFLESRP